MTSFDVVKLRQNIRKSYIFIYIGIVKNVSFFRCSAAAKYFPDKILYPQLIFAAALLNFAAILLSTESDPNSCGPKVLSAPHILDPSTKDWYQYRSWNLTHRAQLRKSGHMTSHTTALLPNSCGPMTDDPFRDPKGRSYPHLKYWTHRWRIVINIDHGISPIEPS